MAVSLALSLISTEDSLAGSEGAKTPLTAGVVLDRMSSKELNAYLSGLVEAFGYARYKTGDKAGHQCIHDWYYGSTDSTASVFATFSRYPNHSPGAVMAAIIKKHCGE